MKTAVLCILFRDTQPSIELHTSWTGMDALNWTLTRLVLVRALPDAITSPASPTSSIHKLFKVVTPSIWIRTPSGAGGVRVCGAGDSVR